jgi:hypothetical protein
LLEADRADDRLLSRPRLARPFDDVLVPAGRPVCTKS